MKIARYRQIYESLRAQIASGTYRAGDRLPTEMELAAQHGVSRVTSAAALTALAREGLVTRVPRRGTVVAIEARPPAPEARPTIAWIIQALDHAYGLPLLQGVGAATQRAGYNLLLYHTGDSRAAEEQAIRQALAAGAAGLALWLQDGEIYNAEVVRLVLDRFPLVLVDRYLRGLDCASVQADNTSAARDLVELLVQAGHRHICAITFPPLHTSTIEDRLDGYTQALAHAGLPVNRAMLYTVDRSSQTQDLWPIPSEYSVRFAVYLRRHPQITAIFASNAWLALVSLRATELLGWRVPDDLSIVSIDAMHAYPLALPIFTHAQQPSVMIGETAVELLREQLDGKPPRRVILPMSIEQGMSIAAPRQGEGTTVRGAR